MSVQIAPWLARSRWPTVPIRYVARLGTGHTPSRQHPEYWENCTIPWMTLADVWQLRDGTVPMITETAEKISELGLANSAAVRHPAGTVILSRTASVGFSAILGTDMATSQDFATWTCGASLEPRYLLYGLRAMAPDLRRLTEGSTHKTIYMPDISQLRIPLPPREEQRRIADYLDAETKRIDLLTALRRQQLTLWMSRRRALISLGTAGLLDEADQRTTNSHQYPAIPGTWRLSRIKYITRKIGSGKTPLGGGQTHHEMRGTAVHSWDVLLNITGASLGRCTFAPPDLGPANVNQHVCILRVDTGVDARYVALACASAAVQEQIDLVQVGGNRDGLNFEQVGNLEIAIPRLLEDQVRVRKNIMLGVSEVDQMIDLVNAQLAVLAKRRQALITAAVTGEIDVTTVRGRAI